MWRFNIAIVSVIVTFSASAFSKPIVLKKPDNFKEAAKETTLSYSFLIPITLSGILLIEDAGKQFTYKMRREHPLWSKEERAKKVSDNMRTATSISMVLSSFLHADEGFGYVATNILFDAAAASSALIARHTIKNNVNRTRPNGQPRGFPSGHSTAAGSRVALSNYNIWNSDLSQNWKYALVTTNWLMAYTVGLARIESHAHYPEDVLAGIALGYWVSTVLKKSFVQNKNLKDVGFMISGDESGGYVLLEKQF